MSVSGFIVFERFVSPNSSFRGDGRMRSGLRLWERLKQKRRPSAAHSLSIILVQLFHFETVVKWELIAISK